MATSETSENKAKQTCNELEIQEDFTTDIHPLYSRIDRVSETHNTLTLNSSRISSQLAHLQSEHSSLTESRKTLQNKLDEDTKKITSLQQNLNTMTKLKNDLSSQNQNLQQEKRKLQSQISNLEDNCGRCLPNWVLMNNTCYYFAVSDAVLRKSWAAGRQECKKNGADLLVINTKEEQEFIVDTLKTLRYNLRFHYTNGFWMGLKDDHTEGTWKWLNGTNMTAGYWMPGEPNDDNAAEDCAAVYPAAHPLRAWNDAPCSYPLKWICEKEVDITPHNPQ
ncbi:uncharacterized protein LOC143480696 isoform X2 [Brachyhypopomus gauderio]|uniref:uncharacterized protein LOC143480696 isoform X2 n=1 Tax=Brachyhypopomus gauderio TaxID=698409 RepID=UPI004040FD46